MSFYFTQATYSKEASRLIFSLAKKNETLALFFSGCLLYMQTGFSTTSQILFKQAASQGFLLAVELVSHEEKHSKHSLTLQQAWDAQSKLPFSPTKRLCLFLTACNEKPAPSKIKYFFSSPPKQNILLNTLLARLKFNHNLSLPELIIQIENCLEQSTENPSTKLTAAQLISFALIKLLDEASADLVLKHNNYSF